LLLPRVSSSVLDKVNYNYLINGSFRYGQRGGDVGSRITFDSTTIYPNNNFTKQADQWWLLSDGNDIVDITMDVPGSPWGPEGFIEFDVETANKKFGLLQCLESRMLTEFNGTKKGTFSIQAKMTSGTSISAIRMAIVSFDTHGDPIAAWGTAGVNPTFAGLPLGDFAYLSTPETCTLTDEWQTFSTTSDAVLNIETGSYVNIGVFVWTDDVTMDVGDKMEMRRAKLEVGETVTDFVPDAYDVGIARCQRYYFKSFEWYAAPALGPAPVALSRPCSALADATGQIYAVLEYPVDMFTNAASYPLHTFYSTGAATGNAYNRSTGADASGGAPQVDTANNSGSVIKMSTPSLSDAGCWLQFNVTTDSQW